MDVQLTVTIPAGLHAQAEGLARRLGLTRSALYAEAVADFLDLHGEVADTPTDAAAEAKTVPGQLSDKDALDQLAEALSGKEWTPEDLETVASLVRATGRPVEDVPTSEPESEARKG